MARLNSLTERGKETQRLLGEILLKLITEKGYDKITVKDITDKANIDRTTFYLHFKDKDDLFLKSQQQIIDELIEYGQKIDQPYPRATLVFEHMAQHSEAYRVLLNLDENSFFSKHLYEFLIKVLLPLLEEQLQGNLQITHTEIELLTGYFSWAFCGLARWWLQTGMPYSPAEIGRRYVEIFRDGFVAASQSWS
jgi:AcrR family transcriptional regulator